MMNKKNEFLAEKCADEFGHSFVIPCYKDSSFLRECVESLLSQTRKSNILLTTATPSCYLENIARQYQIPIVVNPQPPSIAGDWNFALRSCKTRYCTLAHQDDIYAPEYTEKMLDALKKSPDSVIAFCDYKELKGNSARFWLFYLVVKRIMLVCFYLKPFWRNAFIKKAILRFGCPVCCPSVTYNLPLLGDFRFNPEYTVNLDWDAWLELAAGRGGFRFVAAPLVMHRISAECETSAGLNDRRRQNEDKAIFRRLWPGPIAAALARIYGLCYGNSKGK